MLQQCFLKLYARLPQYSKTYARTMGQTTPITAVETSELCQKTTLTTFDRHGVETGFDFTPHLCNGCLKQKDNQSPVMFTCTFVSVASVPLLAYAVG